MNEESHCWACHHLGIGHPPILPDIVDGVDLIEKEEAEQTEAREDAARDDTEEDYCQQDDRQENDRQQEAEKKDSDDDSIPELPTPAKSRRMTRRGAARQPLSDSDSDH